MVRLERSTYAVADVVIATNESYRAGRARTRAARRRTMCSSCAARPKVDGSARSRRIRALRRGKPHLLCYLGVMGPQDGVDYALRSLAQAP